MWTASGSSAPGGRYSSLWRAAYRGETIISSRLRGSSPLPPVVGLRCTSTPDVARTLSIHSAQTWSSGMYRSVIVSSVGTIFRSKRSTTRRRTWSSIGGSEVTSPSVICDVSASYAASSVLDAPGWSPKVANTSSYA
jgi:hypothetical protein